MHRHQALLLARDNARPMHGGVTKRSYTDGQIIARRCLGNQQKATVRIGAQHIRTDVAIRQILTHQGAQVVFLDPNLRLDGANQPRGALPIGGGFDPHTVNDRLNAACCRILLRPLTEQHPGKRGKNSRLIRATDGGTGVTAQRPSSKIKCGF
ncbi:MAG: hypothetical protein U1E70_16505 [Acetobacteraceae bacterium]